MTEEVFQNLTESIYSYSASIEHQIDIHVQDLCTVSAGDYTLEEILQGLKYVLDYRIKGKKMPNLDKDLMKKLAEGSSTRFLSV